MLRWCAVACAVVHESTTYTYTHTCGVVLSSSPPLLLSSSPPLLLSSSSPPPARLREDCLEAGDEAQAAAIEYVNAAWSAIEESRRLGEVCCSWLEDEDAGRCDAQVTALEGSLTSTRDAVITALDQLQREASRLAAEAAAAAAAEAERVQAAVAHWAARRDAALALLATCSERLHTAKNVRLFILMV